MISQFQEKDWDPLVELLRTEVQEYGGLYNLLERQQHEIFERQPDAVLQTNAEIERYMADMGELRERREGKVSEMARACGSPESEPLAKLLPSFPEFVRPLLQALADEVNDMVRRTRRKARQNFLLLSRTMAIAQETMQSLQPDNYTKTYSKKGKVGVKSGVTSRYKAFV